MSVSWLSFCHWQPKVRMSLLRKSGPATAFWLGLSAITLSAAAQTPSTVPPSKPTSVTPLQSAQSYPTPPAPHHAEVTYSGGLLSVRAANSSLNQILRDISREIGMKISGGVAEDRVFGSYGPDAPAKVIRTLLDGTQSNMLLVENGHASPTELILTPRTGGVTPPNPSAFHDEPADTPPQASAPPEPTRGQPQQQNRTSETTQAPANEPGTAPAAQPAAPSAAGDQPAGADQQPPNGVKTPQQIYEQLQKLRSQQAAPPQ